MAQRFAAIRLDHRHIYDLVGGLLDAGMQCAGYWPQTIDPRVLAGLRERFPDLAEIAACKRILDDPSIDVIVSASVPRDRAPLAMAAMRRGKDVMVDKPGVTTFDDLAAVERCVAETGRIFSVCFSERFLTPSTEVALDLVGNGAIGRVIHTVGLGPHRLNRDRRPEWFWDRAAYGGILIDIASHQIDQFITFTGSRPTEIVASSVGSYAGIKDFDDFGEFLLRGEHATGYLRVDWFTPDGLATWGEGRLTVLGTEGTIELRKYIDIEGQKGTDHLFLADHKNTRRIHCEGRPLSYFRAFAADVANRSQTAMEQRPAFDICRLALQAQACATQLRTPQSRPA
jgi:predicted dehydrogenase